MSGAIATKFNLYNCKLTPSPCCPVYDQEEVTIEHLIFLCPWTQATWFASNLSYKISTQAITSLDHWFSDIFQRFKRGLKERDSFFTLLSFLMSEIWKSKCNLIFKGGSLDPIGVSTKLRCVNFFWLMHQCPHPHHPDPPSSTILRWAPPDPGWLKIKFDGSWTKQGNRAGLGVISRDEEGTFRGGMASPISTDSAFMAKAQAALKALEHALQAQISTGFIGSGFRED